MMEPCAGKTPLAEAGYPLHRRSRRCGGCRAKRRWRERQKGGRRSGDWPPTHGAGARTASPAAGRTREGHHSLPGGLSDVALNVTIPLKVEQTRQARPWIVEDTFEPALAARKRPRRRLQQQKPLALRV